MDHQPLRKKYGSAHDPILVAKCALARPANDVETRTPRRWKDAASRTIRLVAIESRFCFSFWKDHKICAAATVEQPRKKSSPGSITFRSRKADLPIQHRAESEGADHSFQSRDSGTLARGPPMGDSFPTGPRPQDRLPNHQRPS